MAGGEDRLSELPDDLLRRVLHFAPLKEAASTTALSRRWREPLWLSSGAVNLETGVQDYYRSRRQHGNARFFYWRDAFTSAVAGTLEATDVPVTRLTMRLQSNLSEARFDRFDRYGDNKKYVSSYTDLVHVVLSHRAVRRVEELRLVAKDPTDYLYGNRVGYKVSLDSLPFETIRVLELTNCKGLTYQTEAATIVFPRLSSLRLSQCEQHLISLQRLIDAAPVLAAIRLESVRIDATASPPRSKDATTHLLRCPAATMLVLDSCRWKEKIQWRGTSGYNRDKIVHVDVVEIHTPRLRRFRYKGPLCSFSFSPQPLELEQVDIDFFGHSNTTNSNDPDRDLDTFWRFARSFTSTKQMRLRVNHLEDMAVLGEARRVELLPTFHSLDRLEVQGANSTILNMLRCCPVLTALRINLAAEHKNNVSNEKGVPGTHIPQKEINIADLLGPSHLYECLESSLARVGLQSRLEKSDCIGVKLIQFFAENAMVLEEMYIDGGDEKLYDHMIRKTEKWNSERRKSGATSFEILPLKSWLYKEGGF